MKIQSISVLECTFLSFECVFLSSSIYISPFVFCILLSSYISTFPLNASFFFYLFLSACLSSGFFSFIFIFFLVASFLLMNVHFFLHLFLSTDRLNASFSIFNYLVNSCFLLYLYFYFYCFLFLPNECFFSVEYLSLFFFL